jgi:uncharacterized membrane protein YbhN (UPF0104 family)
VKKTFHYVRPLASVASLALLFYVLRRTGVATIIDGARALGAGFVLLVLVSGLRHALRTVAWRASIEPDVRRPGLLSLFRLRLIGEGLNGVTPAGPLLGESAKAVAASKWMPAAASTSSVLVENLIYGLAAGLFMLGGALVALVAISTRPHPGGWIVVAFMLAVLLVPWAVLRRGAPLIAPFLERLPAESRLKRFLEPYESQLGIVEAEVYRFFRERRTAFTGILGLEVLANCTGVAEAYLILRVTTLHASLPASFLVEAGYRAVQVFFAFVPFGLGVEEGAAAGTLKSLGYGIGQGVSLAILRRARTVFWSGLGLLLAAQFWIAKPVEEGSAA